MITFSIAITHKATQVYCFLYCDLRQCPPHIKCMCYKSVVCPILEYAYSVWNPQTNVNIHKVQK